MQFNSYLYAAKAECMGARKKFWLVKSVIIRFSEDIAMRKVCSVPP